MRPWIEMAVNLQIPRLPPAPGNWVSVGTRIGNSARAMRRCWATSRARQALRKPRAASGVGSTEYLNVALFGRFISVTKGAKNEGRTESEEFGPASSSHSSLLSGGPDKHQGCRPPAKTRRSISSDMSIVGIPFERIRQYLSSIGRTAKASRPAVGQDGDDRVGLLIHHGYQSVMKLLHSCRQRLGRTQLAELTPPLKETLGIGSKSST